jgi:hypothetical protein
VQHVRLGTKIKQTMDAKSDNIDIQLRDERDRIVDLYGADWVMTAYVKNSR